jgi:hypothetical protein
MQSNWMRTNYDFGHPYVVLELSYAEAEAYNVRMALRSEQPDRIAEAIEAIIGRVRPELAGGRVVYIEANLYRKSFVFGFTHPALPRTSWAECRTMPLVPEASEPPADSLDTPHVVE